MTSTKRVCFIENMGEPGSYDASVYDHFDDKDHEGVWFIRRFGDIPRIELTSCNVCIGESLPNPDDVDGVVLAGSYNSVHDNTEWQQQLCEWFPLLRERATPMLAVCGSHQLLAYAAGAAVQAVPNGPYAGTFGVRLTEAGRQSPIMRGIADGAPFQFANGEHVKNVPVGATLLATSGAVTVAALDFGNHWYSTQFHPEGTHETLSTVWRFKAPELMDKYFAEDSGYRLVRNFLELVVDL